MAATAQHASAGAVTSYLDEDAVRDNDGAARRTANVLCRVTYQMPAGHSAEQIQALFAKTADIYVGVRGLVRKYFGHSDDRLSVVGIYLWESKADADAFYSPDWVAGLRSRWGSMPHKAEWQIPQVVESAEGRVITDAASALAAAE